MKKFLLGVTFLVLASMSQPVFAKTVQVEALSDFSTVNPPQTFQVKIVNNIQLNTDLMLLQGYVVTGKIINVADPKRLKRNASFSFVPINYIDNHNEKQSIDTEYVGKYTTTLNTGELAKTATLAVGNHFVKGLSTGYKAVEGAVKNEEGNRLKSTAVAIYDSTPLAYIDKGEDIVISKNQIFYLNFKTKDEESLQEPNYNYTPTAASQSVPQTATPQAVAPQATQQATTPQVQPPAVEKPIILKDDSIKKTTKDFPGEKLNSFDNGSNFNISPKPVLETNKINNNINSLKHAQ